MKKLPHLTPKTWIKHYYARTENNQASDPGNPKATKFCLVGHLQHVYTNQQDRATAYRRAEIYIAKQLRTAAPISITTYNDMPGRSLDAINACIDAINRETTTC